MRREIIYHCVYRITRISDWMVYLGKHSGAIPSIDDIGKPGGYFSSSQDQDFMKDQKENPENYQYEILKTFETAKAALDYEIYLHAKHDVAINPRFINRARQTPSGFDRTGRKGTPEESQRKREAHALMKEDKENYSEICQKKKEGALKGQEMLRNNPARRKESSAKISEAQQGSTNSASRPVIRYSLKTEEITGEWSHARAAADETGVHYNSLCMCANKEGGSCGGDGWRYKDGIIKRKKSTGKKTGTNNSGCIAVVRVDPITGDRKKYDYIKQAADDNDKCTSVGISEASNPNNPRKIAGGFLWER